MAFRSVKVSCGGRCWLSVAALRLVALVAFAHGASEGRSVSKKASVVVSYLPEWRYEGANWDTISEHSSHLLLFSIEPDARGFLVGMDRFPRDELLKEARAATRRHGTKLMVCFGGNGRSSGFSDMVRSSKRRSRFVSELGKLLDKHDLDGVDYNWEYPGYKMGRGYLNESEIKKDYKGLSLLVRETRELFDTKAVDRVITMAYYPDGRQESLIKQYKIDEYVDLMHMMSYDASGNQHSSMELGTKSVEQGIQFLPRLKITMGVPFYGRHSATGEWTTYEDLVQRHDPLSPEVDSLPAPGGNGATIGFNGVATIAAKTKFAAEQGIAGVMIWEVGQDCRLAPVTHGSKTHPRTCPEDKNSLLLAITEALKKVGRPRMSMANASFLSGVVDLTGEGVVLSDLRGIGREL